MANYNKVTETKFKATKILLNSGASVREVMKYMELSEPVVYGIRNAENYGEYVNARRVKELERKQVAAIKAKEREKEAKEQEAKAVAEKVGAVPAAQLVQQPAPVAEHKQTLVVQASWQMQQEMRKTNELLECISRKLAFIVDELCGVKPPKEG